MTLLLLLFLLFCFSFLSFLFYGSVSSHLYRPRKDGYFYKIAEHPAAKGLIFSSGAKEDALSTLHPTIAHEALRVYRRDASILIREFIDAIDPDLRGQRIFLANLLYRLALDQQELFISKLLEQYAITIIKVLDASSTAELTNQW